VSSALGKIQFDNSHTLLYNAIVVAGAWLGSAAEGIGRVAQETGAGKRPNWPQLQGLSVSPLY